MEKILKRLNIRDKDLFVLFCFNVIITVVYIVWRLLFTINYLASPLELVWPFMLLGAELYSFFVFFMFSVVTINNRTLDETPRPKDINYFPTVDVFICTYNESVDILHDTLIGAVNINYKKKRYTY